MENKSFEIVAFDIGGTQGRCGLARGGSDQSELFSFSTIKSLRRAANEGGAAWLERLILCADELGATTPCAVAISFGGPVASDGSIQSMHVSGWENVDLTGKIAEAFDIARESVFVENDANAGALGESRFGAGRGCSDMLFFTVSTGVGGGVILDRKLRRGAHGMAGEFGHMIMDGDPSAPQYAAGKQGALEALACGPAIEREGRAAKVREGKGVPENWSAKDIFEAARNGEKWAIETRRTCVNFLGRGIATAVSAYDVERVVVGGGVAMAGDALFVPLREAVERFLPKFLNGKINVVPAALGDQAPMFGAVAACLDGMSRK